MDMNVDSTSNLPSACRSVPDALLLTDTEGKIIFSNIALNQIFDDDDDDDDDELIGHPDISTQEPERDMMRLAIDGAANAMIMGHS